MTEDPSKHDVAISKILSYWLRHNPAAGDLFLSEEGWAPIEDVLRGFRGHGRFVTEARLMQAVESGDKQRFEVDGERIRATHGHSVPVELALEAQKPPGRLYHGTAVKSLGDILAQGLKPMRRQYVHLSSYIGAAREVGQRRAPYVVLTINATRLWETGTEFYLSSHGVWMASWVSPEAIMTAVYVSEDALYGMD